MAPSRATVASGRLCTFRVGAEVGACGHARTQAAARGLPRIPGPCPESSTCTCTVCAVWPETHRPLCPPQLEGRSQGLRTAGLHEPPTRSLSAPGWRRRAGTCVPGGGSPRRSPVASSFTVSLPGACRLLPGHCRRFWFQPSEGRRVAGDIPSLRTLCHGGKQTKYRLSRAPFCALPAPFSLLKPLWQRPPPDESEFPGGVRVPWSPAAPSHPQALLPPAPQQPVPEGAGGDPSPGRKRWFGSAAVRARDALGSPGAGL